MSKSGGFVRLDTPVKSTIKRKMLICVLRVLHQDVDNINIQYIYIDDKYMGNDGLF